MQKIGAAVAGVGIYGKNHVKVYRDDPSVELLSVWSRTEKTAADVSAMYNVPSTTDLDTIANNEDIRIVSIATPDFAHVEPAVKMLLAGKDVLLEKPMATTSEGCNEILKAQKKGGGKLMINFHNRWYPSYIKAREAIHAGDIGDLNTAYLRLSDKIEVATKWLSWSDKSGPHWFLFPHIVDLLLWISGDRVSEVSAYGFKEVLKSMDIDTYDVVQAQIKLRNSVITIESSWILPQSWPNIIEFRSEFYGTEGGIRIVSDHEGITVISDQYRDPLLLDPITEDEPIKYFIDCVKNNVEPEPTGTDGLRVTKVVEAINLSLKTGQKVSVDDWCC